MHQQNFHTVYADYLSVTDLRVYDKYLSYIYLTFTFVFMYAACIVNTCIIADYLVLTDLGANRVDSSAYYVFYVPLVTVNNSKELETDNMPSKEARRRAAWE